MWKPEYAANRRAKYQSDPSERERRKTQGRSPEENREYMRAYFAANPDKSRKSLDQRDRGLRSKYGITIVEYDAILADQGGRCAICGVDAEHVWGKRLFVDHCHDTGKIRGLLCKHCNWGIGQFGDDPEKLGRALAYLVQSKQ